jgi:signal transduction histidine kinase
MARQIAVAVLTLITAVLAVVAIPLGLLVSAQDRRDFWASQSNAASTLASVDEERIDDGVHSAALTRSIRQLQLQGDWVAVYSSAGQVVAATSRRPVLDQRIHPPVPRLRTYVSGDRMVVLAPVVPDVSLGSTGTVALSRSMTPLDHEIAVLWVLIGGVAATGLAGAAIVAVGLARWLSRPITTLAGAARRLGEGALHTRTHVSTGPPEVQDLSNAFDTMAARIESLVRGHQALMADVSHQVRTPLAALRLRLDLLAQDADDTTAAELAGAQEEIARLARLTNGLLAVARAEHNTERAMVVDVAAVAGDRCETWRPVAAERDMTLDVSAPKPLLARLGAGHLEQILDNLLANALDALPAGGLVTVTAQADGQRVRLVIRDNGCGMAPEQQHLAFRRYSTGAGGTGLGLAIVDRLATANGGSVALSNSPGGGLTVTIDLPRCAAADDDYPAARPASEAVTSGKSGRLNQP